MNCALGATIRLFTAFQVPIIVDDVAPALGIIIELGMAHIAVPGGAVSFQIVTLGLDLPASLSVRAARDTAHGPGQGSSHAAQGAILIPDLTVACSVIMQAGV